jgi:hypothetical protein
MVETLGDSATALISQTIIRYFPIRDPAKAANFFEVLHLTFHRITFPQMHRIFTLAAECISMDHPRLAFAVGDLFNTTDAQAYFMHNAAAVIPAILPILSAIKANNWSIPYTKAMMRILRALPQVSRSPDQLSSQEQADAGLNSVLRTWRMIIQAGGKAMPDMNQTDKFHEMRLALVHRASRDVEAITLRVMERSSSTRHVVVERSNH